MTNARKLEVRFATGSQLLYGEATLIQAQTHAEEIACGLGCNPAISTQVAADAWIYVGGAHHTGFSQALTTEHLKDLAETAGIELIVIDAGTSLRALRRELYRSDAAYAGSGARS